MNKESINVQFCGVFLFSRIVKPISKTQHIHDFEHKSIVTRHHLGFRYPLTLYMTHSNVLCSSCEFWLRLLWKLAWKVLFCVCVIMATNLLELATTLTYLGGNWLPEKKVNFTPCKSVIFAEGTIVQVHFRLEAQTLS